MHKPTHRAFLYRKNFGRIHDVYSHTWVRSHGRKEEEFFY